jgi:hypothetical protein
VVKASIQVNNEPGMVREISVHVSGSRINHA